VKLTRDGTAGRDEAGDLATADWLRAAADEVRASVPHGLVPSVYAAAPAARRRRRLATVVPATATAFTVAAVVTGTVLLTGGGSGRGTVPATAVSRPLVLPTAGSGPLTVGAPSPGAPSPGAPGVDATRTGAPAAGATPAGPAGTNPAGPAGSTVVATTRPAATPRPTVASATVPNVVGRSGAEATSTLQAAGFTVSETRTCAAAGGAAGVVTAQKPAAGAQAAQQSAVALMVTGDCVAVPNVVGTAPQAAQTTLQNAGFQVAFLGAWSCPGGYEPVTAQSPSAGTRVAKGSTVSITYDCASGTSASTPGQS